MLPSGADLVLLSFFKPRTLCPWTLSNHSESISMKGSSTSRLRIFSLDLHHLGSLFIDPWMLFVHLLSFDSPNWCYLQYPPWLLRIENHHCRSSFPNPTVNLGLFAPDHRSEYSLQCSARNRSTTERSVYTPSIGSHRPASTWWRWKSIHTVSHVDTEVVTEHNLTRFGGNECATVLFTDWFDLLQRVHRYKIHPSRTLKSFCSFLFLGVLANCIPYTILLAQQSGSSKGVLIVYVYQLFISFLILCVINPYYRTSMKFENSFALFTNAQKRIDLQAEQIALSDRGIVDIEQGQLRSKLDKSVRAQQRSGCFYGLLVACSVLGNWSSTIINYAIPSAIFFHLTPDPTASQAASIIALTVYTGYLQSNLAVFNSHGQPISQVWTIGRRITQNLGKHQQRLAVCSQQKQRKKAVVLTGVNLIAFISDGLF